MKTLSLKLPEMLFLQVERETKIEGVSKSELLRIALKKYFALKAKKKITRGSFLDQAQDLCGIVSLPENRSTNKKYMKGYGK